MFLVLSLVLSLAVVSTEGTYVASFPNSLIPGVPLNIRVHFASSSGDVDVVASLNYAENNSEVVRTAMSVQNGGPETINVDVPANLLPSHYKLSVSGSGGLVFHNESRIHYEEKSLFVFIQTDKSRYSAGQTVKFRAAFILPNLLNYQGEATITIKDGKGNKIEVIGPQTVTNGVLSGSLQLSNEPAFGEWVIVVQARETSTLKAFEVFDYILPKFLVDIKFPDVVKTTQSSLPIDIEARFTFNADVLGNCTLLIYTHPSWNHVQLSKEIQGTARFTIPMSNITRTLYIKSNIYVRATVVDHATTMAMITERELSFTFDKELPPVSIRKLDYKDSFIPGMTYETTIFIGRGDVPIGKKGNLYVSSSITSSEFKTCNLASPHYTWLNVLHISGKDHTISFDESGLAKLSLPVSRRAEHLSVQLYCNETSMYAYRSLDLFAVSNDHLKLIQIYSEKTKTGIGERIPLHISSTDDLDGDLVLEIYSRGILINTDKIKVNHESHKQYTVAATEDMVPQVYILLSHLTKSGELLSDYVTVHVSGNPFKNKINIKYSKTDLKPGEALKMEVSADPHSKVYVMVEDLRNRILGAENDIFANKVKEKVIEAGHGVDENINQNKLISGKKRSIYNTKSVRQDTFLEENQSVEHNRQNHLVKRAHGHLGDLDDVYIESGLVVLTDAKVFEKNDKFDLRMYNRSFPLMCPIVPTQYPERTNFPYNVPTYVPIMMGSSLGSVMRSKFPETWIWEEYDVGLSGTLTIEKTVPDSITSWVISVFATNQMSGFGITDDKSKLTVKKSFFVTMDLPSSIVHGEEFLLQLSVFNYMATAQQVFIQTTMSDNPQSPIPASTVVKPGEGHSTYIYVTPKAIGTLTITVMAKAGSLFTTTASDSLQKNVTVKPHGVYRHTNEQHLVDVKSGSTPFKKTFLLNDPKGMVPGTKTMQLKMTGNFMVPSIDGLQNLIRMPYGCGEQTMLNFAPDIYIAKYLKAIGKLSTKIQSHIEETLKSGLQRELTYQHHDGSFSAFGDRDPSGSSWLTAFVLKCFHQADGLIKIDDSIMTRAMNWLLKYQHSDGSFGEPGRVIHTQLQAGTASGIKLTAFILVSILENRNMKGVEALKISNAINKGRRYLETNLHSAQDVYALAILCYALASGGSSSGSTCFTKLKNAALLDGEKMYWKANSGISKRALSPRAPSADIEASSYALMTYMKLGKASEGFSIVKWLVSQRNPNGGFQSTQDTVISLQALSEFSASHGSIPPQNYGVQFNAFGSNFAHSYSIKPNNFDVVHSKEIPASLHNVILQAIGEGSAVIDILLSYYVDGNKADDHISVDVTIVTETLNSVTTRPCITWKGPSKSGMIVAEVEMPTGFRADNEALKKQQAIKRHETNGRTVALYFDGIEHTGRMCIDVKMDRADPVVKSQACHVTVYDYYEPTHNAVQRYEFGILKNSTICSICKLCTQLCGTFGQIGVGK